MTRRYALLLDGAFVTKRLYQKLHNNHPTAADVIAECTRIRAHPRLVAMELLRIYFYDAPPAKGKLRNPIDRSEINLTQSPIFARMTTLHEALELSEDFAIRRGEIQIRGWTVDPWTLREIGNKPRPLAAGDLKPNLKQKGVDLRIGLDIARLSLCKTVDAIVVVTGDSDILPAFKFARREGVRVFLEHMGSPVNTELKKHADVVL